ncbi:hypothetical protein DYB26_006272 [Aphanomyces astaci]|uniref:Reverse transcriptase domain-containing protein n=1 Tax=Aphanomyces astaci TaxID=112090 RepID=A0A397CVC0_APHAT|nr:hypothetical protein DYB38_008020 [Aphanomyces astaci]RHZ13065.1 hypothetical protein DYB26_006272 [Aphanomyces astaci]
MTTDSFGQAFWSHDTSPVFTGQAGVGLLLTSSCPLTDCIDLSPFFVEEAPTIANRYMVIQGTLHMTTVYVHVVYAPVDETDRAIFFTNLPTDFPPGALHIVCGDFNTTTEPLDHGQSADRRARFDQSRLPFLAWQHALNVVDPWRLQNPEVQEYTAPHGARRIDLVLLSPLLFSNHLHSIKHAMGMKWHLSDHVPILFTLHTRCWTPRSVKPPWRCPPWLLQLKTVQTRLRASLDSFLERLGPPSLANYNPGCLLDEHKRADSIILREAYEEYNQVNNRKLYDLLVAKRQREYTHRMDPSHATATALETASVAYDAFYKVLIEVKKQNKFDKEVDSGESCSRDFLRRPSQNAFATKIPVRTESEHRSTTSTFRAYWADVFHSPSTDIAPHPRPYDHQKLASILTSSTASLTSIQRQHLDAPLTARDFFEAITHTAKDKAPGPDGLPIEYYTLHAHDWAYILSMTYASQLGKGRMSKFQRRAHLSLLYKTGDRTLPGSYRPLTLLNADAKLGPKILSYRLGSVLPTIIHEDQFGFIPNRSIHQALFKFSSIDQYFKHEYERWDADHNSTPRPDAAGGVLLDFAKAFDSVLWPVLDIILTHFNFGPTFRAWVSTFFTGTLVSLLFNRKPIAPFELGGGVRQGDPLSPGLFVVFIEPMLTYLRHHMRTMNVVTGDTSHSVLAFADDCTGLLRDLEDTPAFLALVDDFCQATGMQLNLKKTIVVPFAPRLSSDLRRRIEYLGIKVTRDGERAKLLGIHFGPTLIPSERYDHLVAAVHSRCLLWRFRARTLRGKVVILRTIILPLLWYTATVTATTQGTIDRFMPSIVNFVNGSTTSNIPNQATRGQLSKVWHTCAPEDGGLGLPHLLTTALALQLNLFVNGLRHLRHRPTLLPGWLAPALTLFDFALRGQGSGLDILYMRFSPLSRNVPASTIRPLGPYLHQLLCTWHDHVNSMTWKDFTPAEATEMPFWANFLVTPGSRTLHDISTNSTHVSNQGLISIQDFLDHGLDPPTQSQLYTLLLQPTTRQRALRSSKVISTHLAPLLAKATLASTATLPRRTRAAMHSWLLSGTPLHAVTAASIRRSRPRPAPPEINTTTLGISNPPHWARVWRQELKMDAHLLPIFGDLKFRLQHNALGFLYKYGWRRDSVACVHGCPSRETGGHLFWDCTLAQHVWNPFLTAMAPIYGALTWRTLLYTDEYDPAPAEKKTYQLELFTLLGLVRAIVFRQLWLNRNRVLYKAIPNVDAVTIIAQVSSFLHLHQAQLHFRKRHWRNGMISASYAEGPGIDPLRAQD